MSRYMETIVEFFSEFFNFFFSLNSYLLKLQRLSVCLDAAMPFWMKQFGYLFKIKNFLQANNSTNFFQSFYEYCNGKIPFVSLGIFL